MSLTSDDKMIALIGSVETEINNKEYSNCTILDIDPIIARKLFFDRKKNLYSNVGDRFVRASTLMSLE